MRAMALAVVLSLIGCMSRAEADRSAGRTLDGSRRRSRFRVQHRRGSWLFFTSTFEKPDGSA